MRVGWPPAVDLGCRLATSRRVVPWCRSSALGTVHVLNSPRAGSVDASAGRGVGGAIYAANMWESPEELWRRLKLGREEFLQRMLTTLIVGGDPPPWNVARTPSEQGVRFLHLLDVLAHGEAPKMQPAPDPDAFVDEYQQLPYYLLLAAAAHSSCRVDLTYITGPLTKPAPLLGVGQRYSHLQWTQVLPLVEHVWGTDGHPEVLAYVKAVRTVIANLTVLRPSEQRLAITGPLPTGQLPAEQTHPPMESPSAQLPAASPTLLAAGADGLLALAQATAADGRQRGTGATSPADLELLRDRARALIGTLPDDDATRHVMPWLWQTDSTTGRALTPEGGEFGYELRFSRYKSVQVKPGR